MALKALVAFAGSLMKMQSFVSACSCCRCRGSKLRLCLSVAWSQTGILLPLFSLFFKKQEGYRGGGLHGSPLPAVGRRQTGLGGAGGWQEVGGFGLFAHSYLLCCKI